MRRLTYILAAPILVAALATSAFGDDKKKAKPLSAGEVFKRSAPGIVAIDCLGDKSVKIGTASGFLVSDNGKIVTNFHVIQRCLSLAVRLSNGDTYDFTNVVEADPRKDLALIRIKAASMKPLTLGDSDSVEVGQTVFSIGNPSGLQNTLQQGLVSALRQDNGFRVMQVSASINLGNSGGPILDDQARVIAVAAAKMTGAENLGFAIPINYVKGLLDTKTETAFPVFAAALRVALANAAAKSNTAAPAGSTGVSGPGVANPGVGGGLGSGSGGGITRVPFTGPAPVLTKIETLAGRTWKFDADGKPALQATLGRLHGVACDRAGNIYVTDNASQAILKIDVGGRVRVLAGPDSAPRDRPVFPQGIAVDSSGVVYFAESGQRVRKILPTGEVVTVAGGDRRGFTPDGLPAAGSLIGDINGVAIAPDGTVLFAEWVNNRVRRVDSNGLLQTVAGDGQGRFAGDGGLAQQASLQHPNGLAMDADGNLFIADQFNQRVRKVSRDGTITTVAGGGVTKDPLNCPIGVAVDGRGGVLVADPCRRRILAVRNGESSVLGGNSAGQKEPLGVGGPAIAASFDEWAMAVDPANDVLVAGPDYGHLYKIGHDGILSIVAGAGNWRAPADGMAARDALFQGRLHVAVGRNGDLVVSDSGANRIYSIDSRGIVNRQAGFARAFFSGENAPARESGLDQPMGARIQPNGAIVFAERGNHNRIREITPDGKLRTLAGTGRREYSGDGGRAFSASLNAPNGVAIDPSGAIYFADTENQRIRKMMPNGVIQLVAGNGTKGYAGDGGPAERAALNTPVNVEVGPDGSLYIADAGNRRVRKVSLSGVITTVAGDGVDRSGGDGGPAVRASFNWPYNLAFGPDRALYVLDSNAARVRRIDLASGIIATVAGNGAHIVTGDGGDPLQAGLGRPEGFAIDSAGNMYLADSAFGVIRMIHAAPGNVSAASTGAASVAGGVPGGVVGNVSGILGSVPNAAPPPPPPPRVPAIQVSADRMETFLRGKIGVWTVDDAKAVLGAVKDQRQDQQGDAVTFDTPSTAFSRITLRFSAAGKLATTDFFPAQNVKWDVQLAYMKSKFAGDEFRIEQRGDNISYSFPRSRTSFAVQPDGTIAAMSIF